MKIILLKKGGLVEDHARYFHVDAAHAIVPLDKLVPSKQNAAVAQSSERAAGHMKRAAGHMKAAYEGTGSKRAPINVSRSQDGTYRIEDGNSTYAVARKHGWKSLPVKIVKSMPMDAIHPPPAPAIHSPAAASHTEPFTAHEASLPHKVQQPHSDYSKLRVEAEAHKRWQDRIIDRGRGLSSKLGLHVVEGRTPTHEDYAEGHRRGGMVLLADTKSDKRAKEKLASDYNGDASLLKDLSRATVAVSHPDDIPHVVHHLRHLGVRLGARPVDRFKNPTEAGYRDIKLNTKHPGTGHIGELQIASLDHLQAKEHGHKLYEELRSLPAGELSAAHRRKYEAVTTASQKLYGEADKAMRERSPKFALKKAVQTMESHARGTMLKAGLFNYDGRAARRLRPSQRPQVHNGAHWEWVHDLGHFAHEAHPINRAQFRALLSRSPRH